MKKLFLMSMLFIAFQSQAQQTITLNECYDLVRKNYPLAKQLKLFNSQTTIDNQVIFSGKLPQFSVAATATYQSDVIQIPIPNSNIQPLNNDQYRATFTVNQLIYNGNLNDILLDLNQNKLQSKQQQLEVSLYQLKQQINQLYFSILLIDKSKLLLNAKKTQLNTKLKEVQSGIKYGVILPSSDQIIEVEILKISQQFDQLERDKMLIIETLSQLINQPLNAATIFEEPSIKVSIKTEIKRPELELFLFKKEEFETSEKLISKQNMPKIMGFATGGYGNPGLNMLDNSFQPFYIVGLQLNWNVFDWNANNNKRKSLAFNKEIIENEAEIFRFNTNIELNKQQNEIDKITSLIIADEKIIKLRKEVLKTVDSQLKNGVITSSTYITELTNLLQDENSFIKHTIQLALAKENYNVIKGQ